MKRTLKAARRHSQRGAIAVEAAIVFTFLTLFFTLPSVFWAVYFYQYSAAQKAVHDAALYLSTAPRLEMTAVGPDGSPAALTLARKIITKELGGAAPSDLSVVCNYQQASGAVVSKICSAANNQDYKQSLVQITVAIDTSYLDPLTGSDSGLRISPYADVAYMGN